jgi:diguanylate cyclase
MDAALAALLPRLEKAVLESEQRRETRIEQMSTALTALVAQLQSLPLPKEVSRPLKKFSKHLEARVGQAREIPLLLSELSGLQGKALSVLETPAEAHRPGLLQRLFGGHGQEDAPPQAHEPATSAAEPASEAAPATLVSPPVEPVPVPLAAQPVRPVDETVEPAAFIPPMPESTPVPVADVSHPMTEPVAPAPVQTQDPVPAPASSNPDELVCEVPLEAGQQPSAAGPDEPEIVESLPVDPEDSHYALPDSPEPSYSSVAKHIEDTLLGLLGDLTLPERHRPQAEAMGERLRNGLNWYELLPILDDFATLMLAITDSGQHEFEAYLQRLNDRLESFQSSLRAASEGHAEGLKQVLENHLEGLLGTMDQHRMQRDQREQEVSERLKSLAERVAIMEQEAQVVRENLEEQRQKALIDPLTGLPNRAAWSERLEHEVAKWQRQGNSLLLAMLDLDHFKRINDNYGHLAGDRVLKIIATVLRKRLRGSDFIARFGGEEFVLMVPDTPLAAGAKLAEKLRAAIEACPFHFKGEPVTITVSMGLTAFRAGESSDQVLKRADQALYRAKTAGRNRVELG